MNEIGKRMWERDLTIKRWAELNGFSYDTVLSVINGRRGKWRAGKSRKITAALINQGFMTSSEEAGLK